MAQVQKLKKLVNGIDIAMFTTMKKRISGNEKYLHSRPMVTLDFDDNEKSLYFFSDVHSLKMYELDKFNQVNVSYSDPKKHTYVSISGEASHENDRKKMKELWNPMCKTYFPKGVDDPDLGLIVVHIKHVEYWDVDTRSMIEYILGGKPESDHGRMKL